MSYQRRLGDKVGSRGSRRPFAPLRSVSVSFKPLRRLAVSLSFRTVRVGFRTVRVGSHRGSMLAKEHHLGVQSFLGLGICLALMG